MTKRWQPYIIVNGAADKRYTKWDLSSAGRASALQAEGHRFEPCRSHLSLKKQLHNIWRDSSVGESTRFIPVVSGVQIPFPLLKKNVERHSFFVRRKRSKRQRKMGNPAKSVAFKAGNKPKRQRKQRKKSSYVAFPRPRPPTRQRKKGNPAKSVAFKAGNKPKRQRQSRNPPENVASPAPSPHPSLKGSPKTPKNKKSQNLLNLPHFFVIM